MREGGQITDHEVRIARELAYVLCGGDGPARVVSEQDILDLEREAFLRLLGTRRRRSASRTRSRRASRSAIRGSHAGQQRRRARVGRPHRGGQGKKDGSLASTHPVELSALVMKAALDRAGVDGAMVDDVAWGCAMPEASQGLNVARLSAPAPASRSRCRRRPSTASARRGCRRSPTARCRS